MVHAHPTSGGVRLRPFRRDDDAAAHAVHEALAAEGFTFLLGWAPSDAWGDYLDRLDERSRGVNVAPEWVPGTLLAAVVGDELIGRVSVRDALNDWLASYGGHIGYAVLPGHRRRGYATQMCAQALVVARAHGVERVLVTCDDDNIASARVIERCGGVLDDVVQERGAAVATRRYWIR